MERSRRVTIFILAAWTIAFACGHSVQTAIAAVSDELVRVPTITPTRGTLVQTSTQPAIVHAYFEARLFTKVSGYLEKLNVDIGDTVSQGDILAEVAVPELHKQRLAKQAGILRLEAEERRAKAYQDVANANADSYQAKVTKAEAEVARADAARRAAEIELTRMADLVEREAVAERLVDEARKRFEATEAEKSAAEAAVISSKAELALSRSQAVAAEADLEVASASTEVARRELDELDELLKYSKLVAPFDGVVAERHVNPGDLIRNTQAGSNNQGAPLFVIKQLDRVRVRVAIPERDSPMVDSGDTAEIKLQALQDQILKGSVSRAAPMLDERTRTRLVEIDLANADGKLLPGMFGQATILLAAPRESLVLPAGAVRHDEQGNAYVYVVNSASEIEIIPVATGADDGREVEITSGLKGSERVVGPILTRLKAGQKVAVEG